MLEYLEGRGRFLDRIKFPFPMVVFLDLNMPVMDGWQFRTEQRYFLLALAWWLLFITVYFLVSRKKDIRLVPLSLCILAFLSVWGPWGAFSVSLNSQRGRLKALLEKDYYKHATVIVGLDTMNRIKVEKSIGQVNIWGEVRREGAVDIIYGHKLMVSEALLKAGGLTDIADKKNIKVFRKDEHGTTHVIEINMRDVMEKGHTDKDKELEPNDFIIVKSRLIRW